MCQACELLCCSCCPWCTWHSPLMPLHGCAAASLCAQGRDVHLILAMHWVMSAKYTSCNTTPDIEEQKRMPLLHADNGSRKPGQAPAAHLPLQAACSLLGAE